MSKTININNPLTLIGLFAVVTEAVCIAVMPFLNNQDIQRIFLIFVIGFPTLIVVLFFATLNFNKGVLYAPGDFPEWNDRLTDYFLSNRKIKKSIGSIKRNSKVFIDDITISSFDTETKKHLNFVKVWITKIRSHLPLDNFEELILDFINSNHYLLEIRIHRDKLKDSGINRHVFFLFVNEHQDYDSDKREYVGNPYIYGIITGSGYGKTRETADKLADYVISAIKAEMI